MLSSLQSSSLNLLWWDVLWYVHVQVTRLLLACSMPIELVYPVFRFKADSMAESNYFIPPFLSLSSHNAWNRCSSCTRTCISTYLFEFSAIIPREALPPWSLKSIYRFCSSLSRLLSTLVFTTGVENSREKKKGWEDIVKPFRITYMVSLHIANDAYLCELNGEYSFGH